MPPVPEPPSPPDTDVTLDGPPDPYATRGPAADSCPASLPASTTLPGSAAEPPPLPLFSLPGYEILGELGRGGMGVVYKARQTELNRLVAVKVILAGGHAGTEDLARFRAEAEAVARVHHPNVVQLYESGWHGALPFFTLEFVPGGSLADRLKEAPLPPREAARLVEQLAHGIHHAHGAGIVHRDLKPANVLLADDGTPKLTDFGLARRVEASGLTATGAVLGTPSYMAPEQATGGGKHAGPAVDVYALGAVLYECLTGRAPFRGATTLETLQQVLNEDPVPPSRLRRAVPRDLETVCQRCLRKEPAQRYPSALELAEDLGRFLAGEPVRARPVGRLTRAIKWARRRPAVASLLAAVVLLLALGAGGIAWAYGVAVRERDHAREQEWLVRDEKERADSRAEESRRALADSNVLLAQAAWREGSVSLALGRLELVPRELRRWEWRYLRRAYQGGLFTLYGHASHVQCVAYSPDGRRLASCGWDGLVRLWDAHTGKPLSTLQPHGRTYILTCLAFSPDGRRLAVSVRDDLHRNEPGKIEVWDVSSSEAGRPLCLLRGHTGNVNGVAWSPDGTRLATVGDDGKVLVWDADAGRVLRVLAGHTSRVRDVTWGPDGDRLATAGEDKTVRVWDPQSGRQLLPPLVADTGRVLNFGAQCVAFSPDGLRLASGAYDGSVRLWDAHNGKPLLSPLLGHTQEVSCLAFSLDGLFLASGGGNEIRLWDVSTGSPVSTLRGHTDGVWGVAFSPDGRLLASASRDHTVRIWDALGKKGPSSWQGHRGLVRALAFSPDGRRLATGGEDRTIKVWDTLTREELLTLPGHGAPVTAVVFSPDGERLASADGSPFYNDPGPDGGAPRERAGEVRLWDAHTGRLLRTLKGLKTPANSLTFSPDGSVLACGAGRQLDNRGGAGEVQVWDARTGVGQLSLAEKGGPVLSVAFGPKGRSLVSCCANGTLRVRDAHNGQELSAASCGEELRRVTFGPGGHLLASEGAGDVKVVDVRSGRPLLRLLLGGNYQNQALVFSPGGQRLVTADERHGATDSSRTLRVWDTRTGQELLALEQPGRTTSAAFSADGRRIAAGDSGGAVHVWDAAPVQESLVLGRPGDGLSALAVSPDSRQFAAASGDRAIRLWDTRTGQKRLTIRLAGRTGINRLAFSPDGERLASGGWDRTVRVWDCRTGEELLTLRGHKLPVGGVAWSPDGRRLASGGGFLDPRARGPRQGEVCVWDARTGAGLLALEEPKGWVIDVAFSPDGRRLTSYVISGESVVRDTFSGRALPAAADEPPQDARTPDGRFLIHVEGSTIRLIAPPDEEELFLRRWQTRAAPDWHAAEAGRCEAAGKPFAAAFHLERVLRERPWDAGLHLRCARACTRAGQSRRALLHATHALFLDPRARLSRRDKP